MGRKIGGRGIDEKAVRLLAEGRCMPSDAVAGPVHAFMVDGDHGTYSTVVSDLFAMCTCRRWRESMAGCSHIEAATRWVNASGRERDLLTAVLAARQDERMLARIGG